MNEEQKEELIKLMNYPLEDYLHCREKILTAVERTLTGGHYILGEEVRSFEKEFANYLGVKHTIGVASGTDAIELILRALGLGDGDLVAVPSHTAVATVAAIRRAGARPIFIDIEETFFTMCPGSLQAALEGDDGKKIRAIIPVHLYGCTADMNAILKLAKAHDILLIEDACQAHGATFDGGMSGTLGLASAFSFYPTKNLGTCGDAGAISTNDTQLAERINKLRQYGWQEKFISAEEGINSRMDELQASILRIKLPKLAEQNAHRVRLAKIYEEELEGAPLSLPQSRSANSQHVYHLYVVSVDNRDAFLEKSNLPLGVHYPQAVHQQTAYRNKFPIAPGGLPVTEKIIPRILSLPLHPHLREDDIRMVCDEIKKTLA